MNSTRFFFQSNNVPCGNVSPEKNETKYEDRKGKKDVCKCFALHFSLNNFIFSVNNKIANKYQWHYFRNNAV